MSSAIAEADGPVDLLDSNETGRVGESAVSRLIELDFTADAAQAKADESGSTTTISELWQRINLCLLISAIVGITIIADVYAVSMSLGS